MVRYRYFLILILLWLAALLSGGPGADWDRHILVWAELDRGGSLATIAARLTDAGGGAFLLPLTALVALILWFKGRARNALLLLGIVAGGRLLIDGQKYLFGRGRPDVEGHLVAVHSMSFPSAHAGNSTITYLAIALCVAPLLGTKGRIAAIAAAFILAVAIGLSRVALGVHWPSDVVGGWAFGLAWTLTLARLSGLLRA
jgi:undecaprenyl-diphosphatase